MTLATMLYMDEDALTCDMAETYHILDMWSLPAELLATLASGLRDNSRIKMKLAGMRHVPVETIAAVAADNLTAIWHWLTAKKNKAQPTFVMDVMNGAKKRKETTGYATGTEYEAARARILLGVEDE